MSINLVSKCLEYKDFKTGVEKCCREGEKCYTPVNEGIRLLFTLNFSGEFCEKPSIIVYLVEKLKGDEFIYVHYGEWTFKEKILLLWDADIREYIGYAVYLPFRIHCGIIHGSIPYTIKSSKEQTGKFRVRVGAIFEQFRVSEEVYRKSLPDIKYIFIDSGADEMLKEIGNYITWYLTIDFPEITWVTEIPKPSKLIFKNCTCDKTTIKPSDDVRISFDWKTDIPLDAVYTLKYTIKLVVHAETRREITLGEFSDTYGPGVQSGKIEHVLTIPEFEELSSGTYDSEIVISGVLTNPEHSTQSAQCTIPNLKLTIPPPPVQIPPVERIDILLHKTEVKPGERVDVTITIELKEPTPTSFSDVLKVFLDSTLVYTKTVEFHVGDKTKTFDIYFTAPERPDKYILWAQFRDISSPKTILKVIEIAKIKKCVLTLEEREIIKNETKLVTIKIE